MSSYSQSVTRGLNHSLYGQVPRETHSLDKMFSFKTYEQIGNFKDQAIHKIDIQEEGHYKLFVKNASNMLKQNFTIKIKMFDLSQVVDTQIAKSFQLKQDQVPCTLILEFSTSGLLTLSKSYEIILFQEYEKITEYHNVVVAENEIFTKLNSGIYRVYLENKSEQDQQFDVSLSSISFSFPETTILRGDPFLSPPIPIFKSQEPIELKLKILGMDATYFIVICKYIGSEMLMCDIESKDSFKKSIRIAIKNKNLNKITQLLQNEQMRDLDFYKSISDEIAQCKDLLREASLAVKILLLANETLVEDEIRLALEKTQWIHGQSFEEYDKMKLESENILLKMNRKKEVIGEIDNLLDQDPQVSNLAVLQALHREAFEVLEQYRTNDTSESDIHELTNTTILLLQDMKQDEIDRLNRQRNAVLKVEHLLMREELDPLEKFLNESRDDLPAEELLKVEKMVYNLKHAEQIRLEKYMKERADELERVQQEKRREMEREADLKRKMEPVIEKPKETRIEKVVEKRMSADVHQSPQTSVPETKTVIHHRNNSSDAKLLHQSLPSDEMRRFSDSPPIVKENFNPRKGSDVSPPSSELPPIIKVFHRSVVSICKLNYQDKRIVRMKEPFLDDVLNLLNSAVDILENERKSSFFASAKSVLDIFTLFDKKFVAEFMKTKGYWKASQDQNKKATTNVFVKYLLQKKRFVNFIRDIIGNQKWKTFWSDKSVLNDNVYRDELNVTLDLLNDQTFSFSDFEEEKDKTELKQPDIVTITSKKKKIKQSQSHVSALKAIVKKLEDYFLSQSRTKTSIEIGKEDFVMQIIIHDLVPLIVTIFNDGLKDHQHIWSLIGEMERSDTFIHEHISIVKQATNKKSLNPEYLFVTLIKVFFNNANLSDFLNHIHSYPGLDRFYDKIAVLLSSDSYDSISKYFGKIDRLALQVSYY